MKYRYNPYCSCGRCRAHGYMGPAVLITIGVLFLFDQMGHYHWMDFSFTWPALLIVIGLVKLLEHSASPVGHMQREYGAVPPVTAQPIAPPYPPASQSPIVTRPPAAPAGFIAPPSNSGDNGASNC